MHEKCYIMMRSNMFGDLGCACSWKVQLAM
jgi:hypothetical protein